MGEITVILLLALIFLGPSKLPDLASGLGRIIREIRTFRPNVVLAHRPNDYHPDHRAVGQAVQDASYLVTVPMLLPDVPIMAKDPIVGSLPDNFTKPTPL